MQDARFCWVKNPKTQTKFLIICGHLTNKQRDNHCIEGYNTVTFDMLDLDKEDLVLFQKKQTLTC